MPHAELTHTVVALGAGPDGLIAVATAGAVLLLDEALVVRRTVADGHVVAAGFSADGRMALIARTDNPCSVDLLDLPEGGVAKERPTLPDEVGGVAFHPDNATFAVAGAQGMMVWRDGKRGPVRAFEETTRPWPARWGAVAVEDFGRLALAGGERLVVMTGNRWKSVHALNASPAPRSWCAVAFSSDGRWLAAASELGLHTFGSGQSPTHVPLVGLRALAWQGCDRLLLGADDGLYLWVPTAPTGLVKLSDQAVHHLFIGDRVVTAAGTDLRIVEIANDADQAET